MNFFKSLQLRFFPPKKRDPIFGNMTFMYISNNPEQSYWECESWKFPPTNSRIGIGLPGDESGPREEARQFYLAKGEHFKSLVNEAMPKISTAYLEFAGKELKGDLFKTFKLAGFDIEELGKGKPEWSMSFETRKGTWLFITIRFKGDSAFQAVVDT
jgi:hypothetical protein